MKILYLGVHNYKNESQWRSETWINKSFNKNNVETIRIDYRKELKNNDYDSLINTIHENILSCDMIFLQRGENLSPKIFKGINIPIIFWSTEPINLKNDVDQLLGADIFSWVYVHSYGCMDRIKSDFIHLINKVSVLHNALPIEKVNHIDASREYFAIFNRNLSLRRRWWLFPSYRYIKIIKGHYGDTYYKDLSNSNISINIHYSSKNKDDFETGIFEALARGCAVISESLDSRIVKDLNLENVVVEVNSPKELKEKIKYFKKNIKEVKKIQMKSRQSIYKNTWDYRIIEVKRKMENILLN